MAVIDAILQAGAAVGWVSAELDGECERDKVGNCLQLETDLRTKGLRAYWRESTSSRNKERAKMRRPARLLCSIKFSRPMHFCYTDVRS